MSEDVIRKRKSGGLEKYQKRGRHLWHIVDHEPKSRRSSACIGHRCSAKQAKWRTRTGRSTCFDDFHAADSLEKYCWCVRLKRRHHVGCWMHVLSPPGWTSRQHWCPSVSLIWFAYIPRAHRSLTPMYKASKSSWFRSLSRNANDVQLYTPSTPHYSLPRVPSSRYILRSIGLIFIQNHGDSIHGVSSCYLTTALILTKIPAMCGFVVNVVMDHITIPSVIASFVNGIHLVILRNLIYPLGVEVLLENWKSLYREFPHMNALQKG